MVASPEPQRAPRRRVRPLLLVCLILLALVFIAAAVLSAFWLRYEEPGIPGQVIPALSATQDDSGKAGSGVGSSGAEAGAVAETAQGELALAEARVVPAVRRWFGQWVEQHRSLTVSPSFQLSGGSATQIQWLGLADERSQETIGNRAWVQVDVGLHPRLPAIEHFTSSAFTGQSTVLYRQGSRIVGQLVLELSPTAGGYRVISVITPVQYQISTDPSLREEPPVEILPDTSVPATYRIREGALDVTYDSGATWITVPGGYEGVTAAASSLPRTSLDRGGYVVSSEFTGFLFYGPDSGQGQGQGRALALTTGHLPRKARPQQPVKTCLAHHLLATLTCTTTVRPCRPGRPSHLGRDREQRVEGRRRVLAHEADPGRGLSPGGGLVQHLVPVDGQRPCCSQACRQRARDRRTGEGLPGARCSQDGQRSTLRHAAPHPGQQELRSTAARCLRHHPQVVENDCHTGRLYLHDTHHQYKRRPQSRARLGLRA